MIRTLGKRRAAWGCRLAVGVFVILCMGAPTLAAEAPPNDKSLVGILAAIAVPNFLSSLDKSRVAAGVGTGEGIRAAAGMSTPPAFDSALRRFTGPLHRSGIDKNREPTPDDEGEDLTGLRGLFEIIIRGE